MNQIALIKRIFVRQTTDQNCGSACLKMIFACYNQTPLNDRDLPNPNEPVSLAQLKKLCNENSFPARSVEMDFNTLVSLNKPVILHISNQYGMDHFVVCFSCRKINGKPYFLIADPAQQVTYLNEDELKAIWQSNAALYLENDPNYRSEDYPSAWNLLKGIKGVPLMLIPVFAILSLIAAAFGVGLTWLLQRGMIYSNLMQGSRMISLIALLVIIYLARALANYLKQFLLIRINVAIGDKLIHKIISRIFIKTPPNHAQNYNISNSLTDVQRIQAAISAFIAGICCDGTFIFAILGAIFYMMPSAGAVDLVSLIAALICIFRFSSGYSFEIAKLNYFSKSAEKSLKDLCSARTTISDQQMSDKVAEQQLNNFRRTMEHAENHGMKSARLTLLLEILQTINIAAIFFICFRIFNTGGTSYDTLMIVVVLSYIMSSLIPKILNALTILAEGADAVIQINTVYGN